MGRACSTNGEERNVYRILVAKPERKRRLRKLKHGVMVILKSILHRMGWYGLV
jgi:hypothetical protein